MSLAVPTPSQLFDANAFEQMQAVKSIMTKVGNESIQAKRRGDVNFIAQQGAVKTQQASEREFMESLVTKGVLSPDVKKEWDFGTPIPTTAVQLEGITPYNYEQALLMIVARELKLRNMTTRQGTTGGQGYGFRRVTSVSNSGGSSANLSGFFNSVTNTATVNGITKNIPPLISYTGDMTYKPYVEFGLSDSVSLRQRFGAQGFTDADALSHLALLWADFMGEERAFLNGRATVLSITSFAATVVADATATAAGLPSGTATAVVITASTAYGESQGITATGTPTVSAVIGVKASVLTAVPAGTLALNFYVQVSAVWYKGTTPFTIIGALNVGASPATYASVGATGASTAADNGSGNTLGYDGAIQEFNNPALGGYQLALNAAFSTNTSVLRTMVESLYITQGADVDWILTTGSIMNALFTIIEAGGSNNGYRLNLATGENGITVGGAVSGIVNPATGKVVDISAHRYMPAGVAMAHSITPPWADSGVTSCMKFVSAVDHMVIDWPRVDMADITSTYSFGTLIFQAPALSGVITNINN